MGKQVGDDDINCINISIVSYNTDIFLRSAKLH